MIKQIFILSFICLSYSAYSQSPVTWKGEIIEEASENYFIIKAKVDKGWYVYSMNTNPDGPVPTEVDFINKGNFELAGDIIEQGDLIESYDELFEVDIMKYKDELIFKQKIGRIKNDAVVKCEVTYMTCDDKKCLPPVTVELEFRN